MSDIVFEPPPDDGLRHYRNHTQIAARLRRRRGEWARVATYTTLSAARVIARRINKGEMNDYQPAGDFDATTRQVGDKHCLYVRYLGDGPSE